MIGFLFVFIMAMPNNFLFAQDSKNKTPKNKQAAVESKLKSKETTTEQLTFDEYPVEQKDKSTKEILVPRIFFTALLKYDTTPSNPEHRCYEITKPISKKYTFLFNFMSQRKYSVTPY